MKYQPTLTRYVNSTRRCIIDMHSGVATSYGHHTLGMAVPGRPDVWIFAADTPSVTTTDHANQCWAVLHCRGIKVVYASDMHAVVALFRKRDAASKALQAVWLGQGFGYSERRSSWMPKPRRPAPAPISPLFLAPGN